MTAHVRPLLPPMQALLEYKRRCGLSGVETAQDVPYPVMAVCQWWEAQLQYAVLAREYHRKGKASMAASYEQYLSPGIAYRSYVKHLVEHSGMNDAINLYQATLS